MSDLKCYCLDCMQGRRDDSYFDECPPMPCIRPIGLPGPGAEPEIVTGGSIPSSISDDWWRSVPTSRDYLVTAMIQVVVNARNAVEARVAIADQLHTIVSASDYKNDPMNGVLVVEVEDVSLDEDM